MATPNRQYQIFTTITRRAPNGTHVSTSHSNALLSYGTTPDTARHCIELDAKNLTSRSHANDCRATIWRHRSDGVDIVLISAVDDTVRDIKMRSWNGGEREMVDLGRQRANVQFGGEEDYLSISHYDADSENESTDRGVESPQVKFGHEEDYLSSWGYYVDFEEKGFDFTGTVLKRQDVAYEGESPAIKVRENARPILRRDFAGSSVDGVRRRWSVSQWP
jgi:hypothetical protein